MRERQFVADLVSSQDLPKMFKVRQTFPRPRIEPEDIPGIIRGYLSEESFAAKVRPGMRIAITAGSRGIANVALVTKTIADYVKSRGAEPFVVPAMGSHGGATAEGQKDVLESYGITESYLGCPILSSMEVKKIGVNEEGMDVFIDKYAAEADGIIVSCRIKPHTAFRGPYESGIMKMMAIVEHMCLVLVRDSLSPAGRRILMTVIDVLILLFAVFVITIGGFKLALSAQKVFSALLGIPRSLVYAMAPISGLFIILAQIINIYEDVTGITIEGGNE